MTTVLADGEVMRFSPSPLFRAEAASWIDRQEQRYAEHGYALRVTASMWPWRWSRNVLLAVLSAASISSCSQTPDGGEGPQRYFADRTFTSSSLSQISIRFEEDFQYIGSTTFELAGTAHVDRHHLVDVGSDGEVERLVILHFEGFLPESEETYRYRIPPVENAAGPDFRFTLEHIRFGEHDYIHNTWFFNAREDIEANPDRELARSAQLLSSRGYSLPEQLRMSRFVRIVDEEAKHELIIFYLEPLAPTGFRASQFVEGGAGAVVFDSLSAELAARSRAAFRVETG